MKKWLLSCAAIGASVAAPLAMSWAQQPEELVGSWMLTRVERLDDTEQANEPGQNNFNRGRSTRGLLVLDRAGNVFEFFSTTSRAEPEVPPDDPQRTLENFGGFWGRFDADASAGRIDFDAEAGISPNVRGLSFSRDYELDGDRLILTTADEPQAQGHAQFTWQRLPVVQHLNADYRNVMGFWHHIEERRVETATGEVTRRTQRDPSLIVYTPSGFAGVHFPTRDREPFASDEPSPDEAREGVRSYLGYFGSLSVYANGEVSHNVISGISPGTGSILRRFANIEDDVLVVTLGSNNAESVTEVELHRLNDPEDMIPR